MPHYRVHATRGRVTTLTQWAEVEVEAESPVAAAERVEHMVDSADPGINWVTADTEVAVENAGAGEAEVVAG